MEFKWGLLLLPIIAAAIGWFTNFIAVKMLFNPKKPVKIWFITLHGIFPKRQHEIAINVGKMVSKDLLNTDDLQERLGNKDNIIKVIKEIEETLDHYFEVKFPEKFPLLSKVVSHKMRTKVKNEMLLEVELLAPNLIDNQVINLNQVFDVERIVTEKITLLSPDKLETLMMSIIEKELSFIEWVGAILGFIIGLVQILLVLAF